MAPKPLKLVALDDEDLDVISAHLQDAILTVGEMAYQPSRKRFAAILNRFNWEKSGTGAGAEKSENERRRAALRFERVLGVQLREVKPSQSERVLSLLTIRFEPEDHPTGYVVMTFSGGASIRIKVECIEAELADLGPSWRARSRPQHPGAEPGDTAP